MKTHANWLLGGAMLASIVGAGCRGTTSREAPIYGIRNMYDQPKYDVQEESNFFPDHRTMRPLVEGVVAHDQDVNPETAEGRLEDGSGYVLEVPKELYAKQGFDAFVHRGQQRYNVYCMPCHDATGNGYGLVRKRAVAGGAAAFVPPTFHQDRLRKAPDGQIFATISNGKGNMPPYAMQIQVADRWAIIAYVRALQNANPKMAGIPDEPSPDPAGANGPNGVQDAGAAAPMAPTPPKTDAGGKP